MAVSPKQTRVRWTERLKHRLAAEVAKTLAEQGHTPYSYSNRQALQTLRDVMPNVCKPHEVRDLTRINIGKVPWLIPYTADAWPQSEPIQVPTEEVPPTPTPIPTPYDPDTLHLILDTLTSLDERVKALGEALSRQGEAVGVATMAVEVLQRETQRLGEVITKRRQRAREKASIKALIRETSPPPAEPAVKPEPIRITIAGNLKDGQKQAIQKSLSLMPYDIRLDFESCHLGAGQVAKMRRFDHLIVMQWAPDAWIRSARHLFPGQTHVVNGTTAAIDLMHRLAKVDSRCI